MAEKVNSDNIAHLQSLFNQRSPKTKYFSQSRIEQFTQSITKQIINGDTVINSRPDSSITKPKNRYEEQQRKLKIQKAVKQKHQLQKKLSYLNKSIESIQKYSHLKAQHNNDLSKSRQKSSQQLQQSRQREKQLALSIKKHKEKIEKLRQQQNQRRKISHQKELEKIKQLQHQQKQKRKKQILQNLKKIQSSMEERQIQHRKSTQKVKQLVTKKHLFQKMQDQYKQKQEITLEERKKKLSEIRNLYKPIDLSQIKEHQKKVQELKKQKQDIRMRQKKINASTIRYQVPYMSSYYRQIMEKKSQSNDPLESSKLKIDKVKQFASHIRENFVPQVDQRRRQELQKSIQKEAEMKKLRQQKLEETIQLTKAKGIQYIEYLRKLPKKKKQQKIEDQGSKTSRPVYKNYLSHSTNQGSPHKTDQAWNKILTKKELNKKQKARLLQYQSEKVEEYLKRKQQEGRILKKNNEDDIDQQYYNMIKAKLSLLNSDN